MKKLNLSYVLFGVFVLIVVTVLTCGKTEKSTSVMTVPEVIEEKVEAVKEIVNTTIEEKVEEIETRLQEVLPSLDIPALKEVIKEIPVEVAPVEVEAPIEVVPVEEAPVEEIEGESNGD
tara:strand:+ start:347 stop:703 length:357 start_codon:yes stop_codon:yes gene_type:complete